MRCCDGKGKLSAGTKQACCAHNSSFNNPHAKGTPGHAAFELARQLLKFKADRTDLKTYTSTVKLRTQVRKEQADIKKKAAAASNKGAAAGENCAMTSTDDDAAYYKQLLDILDESTLCAVIEDDIDATGI